MTVRLLGRYRLEELLGRGAFATVHAAHDEQLDDRVAVKVLAHNHAADPDMRARFISEGQLLRRLHSPHLISVHDLGETEDGRPFLVLELCDRGTLRQRTIEAHANGWRPADADAVAVAMPLAAAMETMHAADVVHRDLTPANILITTTPPHAPTTDPPSTLIRPGERLVVTDLGFSKDLAARTGLTATGGTDGFQPPEQRTLGGRVDVRSDLWAASAVLSWVLTATVPRSSRHAATRMVDAGVSRPVAMAIADGLDDDPTRRPQTPAAWLAGIIDAAEGVAVGPAALPGRRSGAARRRLARSHRRQLATAVGTLLLIVAVSAVLAARQGPTDLTAEDTPASVNAREISENASPTDLGDDPATPGSPEPEVEPTPTPTPAPMPPPDDVVLSLADLPAGWAAEEDSAADPGVEHCASDIGGLPAPREEASARFTQSSSGPFISGDVRLFDDARDAVTWADGYTELYMECEGQPVSPAAPERTWSAQEFSFPDPGGRNERRAAVGNHTARVHH